MYNIREPLLNGKAATPVFHKICIAAIIGAFIFWAGSQKFSSEKETVVSLSQNGGEFEFHFSKEPAIEGAMKDGSCEHPYHVVCLNGNFDPNAQNNKILNRKLVLSDKVTNLMPEDLTPVQKLNPQEQYDLFANYMEKSGATKFNEFIEGKKFKGKKEDFPQGKTILETFNEEVKAFFDRTHVPVEKMFDAFKGLFEKGFFKDKQSVFMQLFMMQGKDFEKWYKEDWEKQKKIYDAEVEKANRVKSDERNNSDLWKAEITDGGKAVETCRHGENLKYWTTNHYDKLINHMRYVVTKTTASKGRCVFYIIKTKLPDGYTFEVTININGEAETDKLLYEKSSAASFMYILHMKHADKNWVDMPIGGTQNIGAYNLKDFQNTNHIGGTGDKPMSNLKVETSLFTTCVALMFGEAPRFNHIQRLSYLLLTGSAAKYQAKMTSYIQSIQNIQIQAEIQKKWDTLFVDNSNAVWMTEYHLLLQNWQYMSNLLTGSPSKKVIGISDENIQFAMNKAVESQKTMIASFNLKTDKEYNKMIEKVEAQPFNENERDKVIREITAKGYVEDLTNRVLAEVNAENEQKQEPAMNNMGDKENIQPQTKKVTQKNKAPLQNKSAKKNVQGSPKMDDLGQQAVQFVMMYMIDGISGFGEEGAQLPAWLNLIKRLHLDVEFGGIEPGIKSLEQDIKK